MRVNWRLFFAALCALWFVQKAVWSNTGNQWDFRVYYHSTQAWRAGLDPYDTSSLAADRYWLFVAAIVLASSFRLTPLMLLAVCLAARDGRGVRYLAGGLAAFAAIFALSYALAPRLTIEFFQSIPKNYGERGRLNPASLPLVTDAASLLERTSHVVVPPALQLIAYLAIAVAVAVPTWMA